MSDIKNKVIVFGCNHQNMLGLVRSLGEKGIRPYCVCLNTKDGLVFRSKYPRECYYAETPEDGYQYIIEHFSNEELKPILLSTDDITETLFDLNASVLNSNFIVPAAEEDGKITYLMEKQHISILAKESGFTIPEMFVATKDLPLPPNVKYPVFTKSIKSIDGGKKEENVCYNEEELQKAISNSSHGSLLVQKYIDKQTEWCFQGFTDGNNVFLPYVMKYLRYTETAFGGYVRLEKVEESKFIEQIVNLVKSTKYKGLFSVEFILDKDGTLYFTEINFRHDGYSYFTTTGGANLPYLYCRAVADGIYEAKDCILKPVVIGINEKTDLAQFVHTKKVSKVKWLYQCITADSHLLFNRRDNRPFWFEIIKNYFPFFRKSLYNY